MKRYLIEVPGRHRGIWEGKSQREAVGAMWRALGLARQDPPECYIVTEVPVIPRGTAVNNVRGMAR